MSLLLDIGNTRLKWRWLAAPFGAVEEGVVNLADVGLPAAASVSSSAAGVAEALAACMGKVSLVGERPEAVVHEALLSCVADEAVARVVAQAVRRLGCLPYRMLATAQACGVTNAYVEPELLGVDRWLGLIAVRAHALGAACIVGVGTALTVDVLDSAGRHQGGLIVPGPELMRDALFTRTAQIGPAARRAAPALRDGLGVNTGGAIHEGSWLAGAALAARVADDFAARTGQPVAVYLTGGGAEVVAERMWAAGCHSPLVPAAELRPDLVLQGLACVAAARAAGQPVPGCWLVAER